MNYYPPSTNTTYYSSQKYNIEYYKQVFLNTISLFSDLCVIFVNICVGIIYLLVLLEGNFLFLSEVLNDSLMTPFKLKKKKNHSDIYPHSNMIPELQQANFWRKKIG